MTDKLYNLGTEFTEHGIRVHEKADQKVFGINCSTTFLRIIMNAF